MFYLEPERETKRKKKKIIFFSFSFSFPSSNQDRGLTFQSYSITQSRESTYKLFFERETQSLDPSSLPPPRKGRKRGCTLLVLTISQGFSFFCFFYGKKRRKQGYFRLVLY
jgi:hypothetical protein